MAVQMYLVHPKSREDDATREAIAAFIVSRHGFILMATSYGSLIVAFDDQHLAAVRAHSLVEFVGGVTLNPNGPKADALRRVFAENVARQLTARQAAEAAPSPIPSPFSPAREAAFPPGYRPLYWPVQRDEGGGDGIA
jgi:hypothetical protein